MINHKSSWSYNFMTIKAWIGLDSRSLFNSFYANFCGGSMTSCSTYSKTFDTIELLEVTIFRINARNLCWISIILMITPYRCTTRLHYSMQTNNRLCLLCICYLRFRLMHKDAQFTNICVVTGRLGKMCRNELLVFSHNQLVQSNQAAFSPAYFL